jgi:hypothetical protein
MAFVATTTWLLGLARRPEMTNRFPFLISLNTSWNVASKSCGGCGQTSGNRQLSNQGNEALKILATIPEDDIIVFKQMAKVNEPIRVSYRDIRGQTTTIIR